jgi:hypothetical protein
VERNIPVGAKFNRYNEEFAFLEFSQQGCVIAYRKENKKRIRFRGTETQSIINEILKKEIEISEEAVTFSSEKKEEEKEGFITALQLKKGDKIILRDNKEYKFIERKTKRIIVENEKGIQYITNPQNILRRSEENHGTV